MFVNMKEMLAGMAKGSRGLILLWGSFVALTADAVLCGSKMHAIYTVPHELDILVRQQAGHIQGMTCSERAIYLSHKLGIEKIGWDGKWIKHVDAPPHLGDIFYDRGKIYGAFFLSGLKDGADQGMVRVWDEELNAIGEKRLKTGIDGIAVLNETIYFSPDPDGVKPHDGCYIGRLDMHLNELAPVKLDLGYRIQYGVQTMVTDGKDVFLVCYGAPRNEGNPNGYNTTRMSVDLKPLENYRFGGSEGLALVPKSISKRNNPVFMMVCALGGNMQGWYRDPVNNPPCIRLDFYEFAEGCFKDITIR